MASDKCNALSELAERLDPRNCHRNDFLVAVESAKRIIAELANVLDERTYGNRTLYLISSADAVEKCRAIAEEGAKDGN